MITWLSLAHWSIDSGGPREGDRLQFKTHTLLGSFVVVVGVSLGIWPGEAQAQYYGRGGIGAGSTVQGDILRGEGIYLIGLGQYNLSSAMAASINTDTAIKWNQYVYLSLQEDLYKRYLSRMARQAHDNESHRQRLQRILEKPDQHDLKNGDALNLVLMQLIDPRINLSSYRSAAAVVPLTGDTIRKIPFNYASKAATFSMERLIGKRDWPLALRGEEFATNRKAYERAVDAAIELDVEGKLSGAAVDKIQQAVDDFDVKVDQVIPQSRVDNYKQAKNYLKKLAELPRILKEGAVERVIAEIETYPGTSVGDLLVFMQKHNLRFGVAESPLENELYAGLYDSFRAQREKITLPPEPEHAEPAR
jgi:hypothetical protein